MASEDLPANGHGGPADPLAFATKQDLRRVLRADRAAFVASLAPERRAELHASLVAVLAANLPAAMVNSSLGFDSALPVVAGYAPCGSEIDPGPCELYPRVGGNGGLTFHRCSRDALFPGFAGIAEPPADAPAADPGIILVPLVAADARGTRLGQGAGHYDRTLKALRARRPVLVIGVAWDMQLAGALPADPWDEPLDGLATPSKWLTFAPRPPMSRR